MQHNMQNPAKPRRNLELDETQAHVSRHFLSTSRPGSEMEGGTVTYVLPAQPVVYGHINARSPACEIARMAVQPPTLLEHL
jgi:hypothetical protein